MSLLSTYILKDLGAVFPGAGGHGLGKGVRIHVTVVGIEKAQKDAIGVDEGTLFHDFFGGNEPLIGFVPAVTRHLVAHLVHTLRRGGDTNASRTMEADFLSSGEGEEKFKHRLNG